MGSKKAKDGLTAEQEQFCQLYVSQEFFANGVEAYAEAYGIDLTQPGKYQSSAAAASRLLTNVKLLKRINDLLDLNGLNDAFVDKQLTFVITQNADMGAKMAAIREYNKLKQRITDKLNISGDFDITLSL